MKKHCVISRKKCASGKRRVFLEMKRAPHIGCNKVLLRSMVRGVFGLTFRRDLGVGPG